MCDRECFLCVCMDDFSSHFCLIDRKKRENMKESDRALDKDRSLVGHAMAVVRVSERERLIECLRVCVSVEMMSCEKICTCFPLDFFFNKS